MKINKTKNKTTKKSKLVYVLEDTGTAGIDCNGATHREYMQKWDGTHIWLGGVSTALKLSIEQARQFASTINTQVRKEMEADGFDAEDLVLIVAYE